MSTIITKAGNGLGYYEATTLVQKLPACANCGANHPLARKTQCDPAFCPDCGTPTVALEAPQLVPAVITLPFPLNLVVRLCNQIGAALLSLARKVDP